MVSDDMVGSGSTSAQLRQTQEALAASQADLTETRGTVVDLLYIIDAFQIESGADRNASYETGIEAVREMRATIDRIAGDHIRLLDRNMLAEAELASARTELERLRTELADADAQVNRLAAHRLEQLRATSNPNQETTP